MRTVSIIILVFSFSFSVSSQTYHKLIRQNVYWDVYHIILPEMCYTYANRISFTGQDTVIESVTYKKSIQYSFKQINPGPFCPPFQILTNAINTGEYLREDTIEKKVYMTFSNPVDEVLLYDFSLNVGDTLHSTYYMPYDTLICSSIENITLLNGEIRKKFIFNSYPAGFMYYIESIGGINGLFEPILPGFESFSGYFCVSENNDNLLGTRCDNYFVNINEADKLKFLIAPNPAHESFQINVDLSDSAMIFKLIDVNGKEVLHKTITQEVTTIPINGVPPGMYLFSIISNTFNKQGKICIF